MITDKLTRIADMPEGEIFLTLVTKSGRQIIEKCGKVCIKHSKKYFIAKGIWGRASFGSDTIAFKNNEVPKSVLLIPEPNNSYAAGYLDELIKEIKKSSGIILEERISKIGHELVFETGDKKSLAFITQIIKMITRRIKNTKIEMQICFPARKLDIENNNSTSTALCK